MDKNERRKLLLGSCIASIVASIVLYASGKRELGIFIGLWAPTILTLDSYVTNPVDN